MKRIAAFCLPLFILFLSSCAHIPSYAPSGPAVGPVCSLPAPVVRQDIMHVVAPGETVWRIAKMYDVDMAALMEKNSLRDPRQLEMGQKLVVPGAAPLKPVVTLYPSRKWKYIIIHHSATDEGNALAFNRSHTLRGFTRGLGYHFVIDNGTKGKQDGQIEVSPRWLKQEDGAHCKACDMNPRAIGICLVGNFDNDKVSPKQMDSLVYLVRRLQSYYNIPSKHIMGHGEVAGANTDCPGKKFPWDEFRRRMRSK